ncbi:MAG: phosphodiester glycosidase family protein [Armatimonadota bacterium]|nr:phosphodiester glycosidase family protein [Armatimonadota bacterium]
MTFSRNRPPSRRLVLLLLPALAAAAATYFFAAPERDYTSVLISGRRIHVVTIDPRRSRVDILPVLVPRKTFEQVVDEYKPRAAINGTYFDKAYMPIGDIVAQGKVLVKGYQRSAIAADGSGRLRFRRRMGRSPFRWSGFSTGLAAGPMLVRGGRPSARPGPGGFGSFSRALRAPRSAVGLTADEKLLLVVAPRRVTLDEMAHIMLKLGAADAMNLDGGGSCALYGDGVVVVKPYSRMSSVLLVKDDR